MSVSGAAMDRPLGGDLEAEEAQLASRAAAGDGTAFAALYERYERRVYNLCLRITNSEEDAADATQDAFIGVMRRLPKLEGRDLAFGSYVFTAARNSSYDLIEKRKRAEPTDEIPESAVPAGTPGGFDPGDPEEDPERSALLEAQQEEIRAANGRLPERQREVLALRELEGLSYDEIAGMMDMNRNSVAQLLSRARINLRDNLRETALATVAASSADCERALPLIASAQDGELESRSEQDWLATHLRSCDTCAVSVQALEEAGTSYRAWAPIAAAPFLFKATIAKAAEAVGADWSGIERPTRETQALASSNGGPAGAAAAGGTGGVVGSMASAAAARLGEHTGRIAALGAALGALLLLALLATAADDDAPTDSRAPASSESAAPAKVKERRLEAIKVAANQKAEVVKSRGAEGPGGALAQEPGGTLGFVVPDGGGAGGAQQPGGSEPEDAPRAPSDGPVDVTPPSGQPSPPTPNPTPPPQPTLPQPTPPSGGEPTPPPRDPGGGRTCPGPRGQPVPC